MLTIYQLKISHYKLRIKSDNIIKQSKRNYLNIYSCIVSPFYIEIIEKV